MEAPTPVFFAYPASPGRVREAVGVAARRLNELDNFEATTWEGLAEGGSRLLIRDIVTALNRAALNVFELTAPNPNVLFEFGYAVGAGRQVWVVRDPTEVQGGAAWKRLRILQSVRYQNYENSDDIFTQFMSQRPDLDGDTIFRQEIEPHLASTSSSALFYMASPHNTDANRVLTSRVERERSSGVQVTTVDPAESASESLSWYGRQVGNAAAAVFHLASPSKINADIHNARCSFVAGLAAGMKLPVLMLAPDDYEPAFDFQEFLKSYLTFAACEEHADSWLSSALAPARDRSRAETEHVEKARLSRGLRDLSLGEHVAENEAARLGEYFIETAAYRDVLRRDTTIFAGRRGAGKTALLLQAAEALRRDKRQLTVVIKPPAYEVEGVVSMLRRFAGRDAKGHIADALWRFLLLSEVAVAAEGSLRGRAPWLGRSAEEDAFLDFMDSSGEVFRQDFSVRLETAVAAVEGVENTGSVADLRGRLTQAMHEGPLRTLRGHLGGALSGFERVAVLLDNLDKAWQRDVDLEELAAFLFGLLTAVGNVSADFKKQSGWRQPVAVAISVFLRSDILARVLTYAREPDKIPVQNVRWDDPDLLLRVVQERFAASRADGAGETDGLGEEVWSALFAPEVAGMPTSRYVVSRVLPRPRDIVVLCNAALDAAVNRGHTRVAVEDVLQGEKVYSTFVVDAMLVECGEQADLVEELLFRLAGGNAVREEAEIEKVLGEVIDDEAVRARVRGYLRDLTVLGVEVREKRFLFSEGNGRARRRVDALADAYTAGGGPPRRYLFHPAFISYLELELPPEVEVAFG